jgi:hypothetical protein
MTFTFPYHSAVLLHTSGSLDPPHLILSDILFGEVWVVSGQSNAAFTLGMMATGTGVLGTNASAEVEGSAMHANAIRFMNTGIVKVRCSFSTGIYT